MDVQGVRWDKGSTVRAGDYNFCYGKGNHQLGTRFFVHRTVSGVTRVEFVNDRLSIKLQEVAGVISLF